MKKLRLANQDITRIYAESVIREPGFVMASHHCHSYFELFYVERGACRFLIEDNMYALHGGDFIFIPPQVLHYTRYLFGTCKRIAIFFRKENVHPDALPLMPGGEDFFSQMHIFQVPELHQGDVNALLAKMVLEERIGDDRSDFLLSLMLSEVLVTCGRVCHFLQDAPADIHTTDRSILRAARFISDHYAYPITTADIATEAGLSPNYLTRKFREAAGLGLREYLIFTRLQHAALELVSTDAPITEIALRCGFSDGNYFKDVFKKNYGMAPRDYRRMKSAVS